MSINEICKAYMAEQCSTPEFFKAVELHPLQLELRQLEKNERHLTNQETRYWCNQYKQFAIKVLNTKPINPVLGDVAKDGWISVKDAKPKDGEILIAMESDDEIYRLKFTINSEGIIFWKDRDDYFYHEVTHWMPLPPKPAMLASNGKE